MSWFSPERHSTSLCCVLAALCVNTVGVNKAISLGLDSLITALTRKQCLLTRSGGSLAGGAGAEEGSLL